MASGIDEIIRHGNTLSIAVNNQEGNLIYSGGGTDVKCVVNTEDGPQLAYKVVNVGAVPLTGDMVEFVDSLPETGETNRLYALILDETDLEGHPIVELFIWDGSANEWYATGAFSININETNIMYKSNFVFNSSTAVLNIITE